MSTKILGIKDRDHRMHQLYSEELWTLRELADEFGLHPATVGKVFQKRGWSRRTAGPNVHRWSEGAEGRERRNRQMIELYDQGWTCEELARHFGLSRGYTWRLITNLGVRTRRAARRSTAR